jgi:hypothetical protein
MDGGSSCAKKPAIGSAVLAFTAGGSIDTGLVRSEEAASASPERQAPQVASSSSTLQRDADRVLQQPYDEIMSGSGGFMKPDPGGGVHRKGKRNIGTAY